MESPRLLALLPLVFLSCSSLTEPAVRPASGVGSGGRSVPANLLAAPGGDEPLRHQGEPAEVAERAKLAIDQGEFATARALLGGLLVDGYVDQARSLLREDNPQEALVWIDEALDLAPRDREVLVLHGEGSLATGERLGDPLFFEDALRSFGAAGQDPQALFGASRAARLLFQTEDALRYAEAGARALESAERSILLPEAPERTLAQASFDAFIAAKTAIPEPAEPADDATAGDEVEPANAEEIAAAEARAQELFAKTEAALSRLMARQDGDPWAWTNLSNLYLWEGRLLEARQAIESGLESLPANPELLERLYRVSRQEGGDSAVIEAFGEYRDRNPEISLGWWYGARARFDRALSNLEDAPRDELRKAGEMFARCRELEPTYEADCLGWEVMVQNALAWCDYNAGDLEAAKAGFLATEEVLEGGLHWQLEGRLLSGVQGLYFVANAMNGEERFGDAADIFDFLREYDPENPTWANNAGFFNRDAGTALADVATAMRRAAAGEVEDGERLAALRERAGIAADDGVDRAAELLLATADELDAAAEERFRRSYAAYLQASELAPEDVRIVNDTALIQVYHLRDELEKAEAMLKRCVLMGAEQLAEPDLDEDQVFELKNAWGDAYQNLGVLYLEVQDDPKKALGFFEKCVEIGPEARPDVLAIYIPRCKQLLAERGTPAEEPPAQEAPEASDEASEAAPGAGEGAETDSGEDDSADDS